MIMRVNTSDGLRTIKPQTVVKHLQKIHSQIIDNFRQQLMKASTETNSDEIQAKQLQDFLNDMNEYVKTGEIVDEDNPNPMAILESQVAADVVKKFSGLMRQKGLPLFQLERYYEATTSSWRRMNESQLFGHWAELILKEVFNSIGKYATNGNAITAYHLGLEQGLPADPSSIGNIPQRISKNEMEKITSLTQQAVDQYIKKSQASHKKLNNSFYKHLKMTQKSVTSKQMKADGAVVTSQGEITVVNDAYNSIIDALKNATYSQKTYAIGSDEEKELSLGNAVPEKSLYPYFKNYVETLPGSMHNRVFAQILYSGALTLALEGNNAVMSILEQLMWIYELRGPTFTKYDHSTFGDVEDILNKYRGVKFLIVIDNITGKIQVRTTRSVIIEKMGQILDNSGTKLFDKPFKNWTAVLKASDLK